MIAESDEPQAVSAQREVGSRWPLTAYSWITSGVPTSAHSQNHSESS